MHYVIRGKLFLAYIKITFQSYSKLSEEPYFQLIFVNWTFKGPNKKLKFQQFLADRISIIGRKCFI